MLSAIGIFGIVAQVVVAREQEFAIRAALGATPRSLVTMSLRIGIKQTVAGQAIGIGIALVATRVMRSMLQGVTPTDPLTFAAVVVVIGVVAVAASIGPARRAGMAEPAGVLGGS